MPESYWQTVAQTPPLNLKEVHIWRVRLEQPGDKATSFKSVLSPDELERAGRFYFDRDRQRYIVARGQLRWLLADYLSQPAAEIDFEYSAQGKPGLVGEAGVQFNVSHAQDVILLGFCRGTPLGVDVEQVRPLSDMDAVAHRSFSTEEYADYLSFPPEQKPTAFFNCWTRKEAFIKAVGEGLSYPLREFSVALLPDDPVRFRQIRGSTAVATAWTLHSIRPDTGYVGALALKGVRWQVKRLELGFPQTSEQLR